MNLWDFLSKEAGQERSRKLNQAIEYYTPPELRGLLNFFGEMSPTTQAYDAGTGFNTMVSPDATTSQRIGGAGQMLSGMAGVVAPMAVEAKLGKPVADAVTDALTSLPAKELSQMATNAVSDAAYAGRSALEGDLGGIFEALQRGGTPQSVGAASNEIVRRGSDIKSRLEAIPNVQEFMTGDPYVPMSNTSNLVSQKPIALSEHESVIRPTGELVSPTIQDFSSLEGRDVLAIVGDQSGRHDIMSVGKYDLRDDPQRSLAGFQYIDVADPRHGYAGAQSATSSKFNEALESENPYYMSFLMGEKSSDFSLHEGQTFGKMVRSAVQMGDISPKDVEYIDNAIKNIGVPETVNVTDANGNVVKKADGTNKTKSITTYPFRNFTSVKDPNAVLNYIENLPSGTQRAYFLKGMDKTNLYKRGMPKVHDARLAVADEAQMGMDWGTVGYRGFTPDLQKGLLQTTSDMSTTYDTGVSKVGNADTFLQESRGVPANLAFADLSAAQREKGTGGGLLMSSADYKVYESSPKKSKQRWEPINTDTVNTFLEIEKTQGRDVAYNFAKKVLSESKVTNALIQQAKKMNAPQWVIAAMVSQQAMQKDE